MAFRVLPATADHLDQWAELRIVLWPWDTVADHREEAEKLYCSGAANRAAFVALDEHGQVAGFAEAAIRTDYVNGCDTSPVAFLEGIFVRVDLRKQGVARALSDAVDDWGRSRGCTEFASDALLDNADSHAFHAAIGFAETERVVYLRKDL